MAVDVAVAVDAAVSAATDTTTDGTASAATDANANANTTAKEAPPEDSQSRRVYVGNLAWDVSWQDLKDLMKTTGHEVTRSDIMKLNDGRSKGCGIVEFATSEGAKQAVLTLNDKEFKGRQIFVREDREARSTPVAATNTAGTTGSVVTHTHSHNHANSHNPNHGHGHGFSPDEQAQSRRVYVGNLSWDVNWQTLKDHMRQAGEVVHAEVICEQNGRSKGCGVVEYATEQEAQTAIATMTHTELNGRTIFVREDRETSSATAAGSGTGSSHTGTNRSNQNSSVYVWNLSYETSWQDLKDHMRKAGNVDQATILSSEGNSGGCGVVVYQKPSDAARAIRALQDSELKGRQIKLREDRVHAGGRGGGGRGRGRSSGGRGPPRSQGGSGGRGGYVHQTSTKPSGTQVFVGNLPFETNWRDLKDLFKQCGEVDRAEVRRGHGTVRFTKKEDAEAAIEKLNGVELNERTLEVRLDERA